MFDPLAECVITTIRNLTTSIQIATPTLRNMRINISLKFPAVSFSTIWFHFHSMLCCVASIAALVAAWPAWVTADSAHLGKEYAT